MSQKASLKHHSVAGNSSVEVFDNFLNPAECSGMLKIMDACYNPETRSFMSPTDELLNSSAVVGVVNKMLFRAKLSDSCVAGLQFAHAKSPLPVLTVEEGIKTVVTIQCFLIAPQGEPMYFVPEKHLAVGIKQGQAMMFVTHVDDASKAQEVPQPLVNMHPQENIWLFRMQFKCRSYREEPKQADEPLVFLANRGRKFWEKALKGVARHWREGDERVDFMYYMKMRDTEKCRKDGNNDHELKVPAWSEIGFALNRPGRTGVMDNKALCAERMMKHGICDPMTYTKLEDVPSDEPDKLWFVKDPRESNGRGVDVLKYKDIESFYEPGFVVQEAVTDLLLANKRKFNIRCYILVFNNCVYLYPEAIAAIHGKTYKEGSTDRSVQINHDTKEAPMIRTRLGSIPGTDPLMEDIARKAPPFFQAFADLLTGIPGRYSLFGVDYLPRKNKTVAFIEVNHMPNLVYRADLSKSVTEPMFRDLFRLVTGRERILEPGEEPDPRFIKIGTLSQPDVIQQEELEIHGVKLKSIKKTAS